MFSESMWDRYFGGLVLIGVGIGALLTIVVGAGAWGLWWLLHHLAWVPR